MSNPIDPRLLAMLRQLAETAEHASLTGALQDGESAAAQRYNATLRHLAQQSAVPEGLFTPLDSGAGFGQIGVEARMLLGFLEGETAAKPGPGLPPIGTADMGLLVRLAPFMDGDDLGRLLREQLQRGARIDPGILTALAPFVDSDALGAMVREVFSNPASPPTPPSPPSPPSPVTPMPDEPVWSDVTPAPADPIDRIIEISHRLANEPLSPEERTQLANELVRLSHETGRD